MSNSKKNPETISFFVPCLNEEKNIENTINNIINSVQKTDLKFEIIIVDDNSFDNTRNIVTAFKEKNKNFNISLIENKKTMGLGRNYVDISFIAKGKYYMLVNGDNAEPEETILTILKEIGKADMIIPFFDDQDNRVFFRVFMSKTFTFLINFISGYKIKYYNGPVVHLRFNVMRWSPDTYGFAYQAELITRTLDEKATYKHVRIKNLNRTSGRSKAFTLQNIMSVSHSIIQIFLRRLRWILFYRNHG